MIAMILLLDIGNTNTHLGLANETRVLRQKNIPTALWFKGTAKRAVAKFLRNGRVQGATLCSVVPKATPAALRVLETFSTSPCVVIGPKTLRGVGIDYPRPKTIGPDRLANAVAVKNRFGAPAIVVDFGTAVTFDVVNPAGDYAGGIIAPGLAAMTDYLHDKTALLPRIKIREIKGIIGKSTRQAMLIGAVHGYRGLIRGLVSELRKEFKGGRLPVVATGGYAELMAAGLPEISAVDPLLTLDGLRVIWNAHHRLTPNNA